MRHHSHFNTAVKIIGVYNGRIPLAVFLKQFFAKDKKYGSKDRKSIAAFCYAYFRLGKALPASTVEARMLAAVFLMDPRAEVQDLFSTEQFSKRSAGMPEKLDAVSVSLRDIFPWTNELSEGIDADRFLLSFLQQPDLFLRIRPSREEIVEEKLTAAKISYKLLGESCIALFNSSSVANVLELDREAVVQDYHSQQVLDYFKAPEFQHREKAFSVWDCCAASGGKSILLFDNLHRNMRLTVSDIRESILVNLRQRLETANIIVLESFITDLTIAGDRSYPSADITICDAPCTGSGTWSRTPEQLFYFKQSLIEEYAQKQKSIVSGVIPAVPLNGIFVYITCSAFAKENEAIAGYIKKEFHLQLLQMELLKGYDLKADTMFVAVFRKNAIV